MADRYIPTRTSKSRCLLLIGLVILLYCLDNPYVASLMGTKFFSFIFKPGLWILIAVTVWSYPSVRSKAKLKLNSFLYWWAFNFAIIFIAVSVIAGLVDGFGKSPYDHSLIGVLSNLLLIGTMLIGQELVRSYLVNSLADDENYLVFILVAAFLTITSISLKSLTDLRGYEDTIIFIAQVVAPEFFKGLLATYFAFLGGPLPAIIYLGALEAFHWFSPILPNLKWITTALIGILCPVFCFSVMQGLYLCEARLLKKTEQDGEEPGGWILTSIASIAIIWFAVGVFPIYPSVIATGSMEPMIKPGDIILVKKIEESNNLQKGDVIQFKSEQILISHRIIEIVEEKGRKSYLTKGDNNSAADSELVQPEQIKGEIIQVVPKIGWPTLLLKTEKNIPLDRVEF